MGQRSHEEATRIRRYKVRTLLVLGATVFIYAFITWIHVQRAYNEDPQLRRGGVATCLRADAIANRSADVSYWERQAMRAILAYDCD